MNKTLIEALEELPAYTKTSVNAYMDEDLILRSSIGAIIEQYKTEVAEPASKSRIVKDADFQRLEDAIRNLWMSGEDNNKRTYDRICKWLDSLEHLSSPAIVGELVKALEDVVNNISANDDEGLCEHAEPMINARDVIARAKAMTE